MNRFEPSADDAREIEEARLERERWIPTSR